MEWGFGSQFALIDLGPRACLGLWAVSKAGVAAENGPRGPIGRRLFYRCLIMQGKKRMQRPAMWLAHVKVPTNIPIFFCCSAMRTFALL